MLPRLLVFDTESGKPVASAELASNSDDSFLDAGKGRVYVLTQMGFLEVFHQRDPDHYDRIARYPTALEPVCPAWNWGNCSLPCEVNRTPRSALRDEMRKQNEKRHRKMAPFGLPGLRKR
jgi:hypothetical protein